MKKHSGGSPRKTTEQFIRQSKNKFGDKFDYSKTVYKGAYKPIDIICRKHGVFQTQGWHHISQVHGGCPECFRESISSRSRKPISNVAINDGEIDAVHTRIYQIWHGMIKRCHNDKVQASHNAYRDASVCNDWLTFSSFLNWVESSESGYMDGYDLDKDILRKGNKLYSPDTCCFVHPRINKLLIKQGRRTCKNMDLPLGVTFSKGKYTAYCSFGDKIKNLGSFLNPDDAFVAYKTAKESYIKEVAQDYYNNGLMHIRIYNALMNYEISK